MKIAFDPTYIHPVAEGHKFPMEKYELIPEQLLYEGICNEKHFFSPLEGQTFESLEIAFLPYILEVHDAAYYEQMKHQTLPDKMMRRVGFEQSKILFEREVIIASGTVICADWALKNQIAFNVAGGTHHAYANKGEGFCLLNDAAIAAAYLLKNKLAKRILIVDLDVHQGNGTAKIFENNAAVFTFSMHGKDNYPLIKEQSDLDIALKTGTGDEEYLDILYKTLPKLILDLKPDFIFYVAGVDVLTTDRLGKLAMSIKGCKDRDAFVLQTAKDNQIPITVMMAGGYSTKIADIIDAHCNTFKLAMDIFE